MDNNSIVLDGFTLHSACVGSITAAEFFELNEYTRNSLASLIQSLVIHDRLIVGKEVIGPSSRFPGLFTAFGEAFLEKPVIPLGSNREVVRLYNFQKSKFEKLKRKGPYEDELTNFVQRIFFESDREPTEEVLRSADPEIFKIFKAHSILRARMYSLHASSLGAAYVPCPYRRPMFEQPDIQRSLALDLLEEFIRDVREPAREAVANSAIFRNLEFQTPALVQLVLQESKGSGIFETAAQLRNTKGAKDFRALCSEYLGITDQPEYNLQDALRLQKDLERAKKRLQRQMGLKTQTKEIQLNALWIGTKINIPDFDLHKKRPAFAFLYRIMNASYSQTAKTAT